MSTRNNFAEIAAEAIAAKEEYERKTKELNDQFRSRIDAYNTVVRNTARKFLSERDIYNQTINDLVIPAQATLIKHNTYTNTYTFEHAGRQLQIPAILFTNNPILVAQYTRHHIRQLQEKKRAADYKTAQTNLTAAKAAMTKAEKQLAEATATMAAAEKKRTAAEARVYAKLEKRRKELQATA